MNMPPAGKRGLFVRTEAERLQHGLRLSPLTRLCVVACSGRRIHSSAQIILYVDCILQPCQHKMEWALSLGLYTKVFVSRNQ